MAFDHPIQRSVGFFLILIGLFVFDDTDPGALHRLWLPLLMAAGALLLTRAAMAVCFAACILSATGIRLTDGDWISAWAYSLICGVSGIALALMLGIRFRQRIIATREARWAGRRRT